MSEQTQTQWTAENILGFLYEQRERLKAMGVTRIGLFGSYLRGQQQPNSDMDFLFSMKALTWQGWMDVWNFLEDAFGTEVDLVPEKDLREELRPIVMSEVRYVEGL